MQGAIIQLTMPGMSRGPGRRIGTPREYRDAILRKTKKAREKLGWSHAQMAEELTRRSGRPISADTYRQWERLSMIPQDLILPFCDITKTHPYEFLRTTAALSRLITRADMTSPPAHRAAGPSGHSS